MFRDVDKDNKFEVNEVFYFTKDHLNSIRELLDYKGDIYQRYSYTSYGETKLEKHLDPDSANFIENRYAYTSRELDKETGLYYYRARWYDPESGRFMSEDPIGFAAGDTNLYRYVLSHLLRYCGSFKVESIRAFL